MSSELEERVKRFVAQETATKLDRLTLDTTLFGDLGVDGADGWELIETYGKEFNVDLSGFDPSRHFGPEAGGNPISLLWFIEVVLNKMDQHEFVGVVPISIRDLVQAAETGQWPK